MVEVLCFNWRSGKGGTRISGQGLRVNDGGSVSEFADT